jgi:chromosome segregation ATPase
MFISKYDKEEMRVSIRTLQAENKEIKALIESLNERFDRLAAYAVKKKARVEELEGTIKGAQEIINESDKTFEVIFTKMKTKEAPWGYKKDGTPKKRPGPQMQVMKVGQP